MNKLLLSFLTLAATVTLPIATQASTFPASKYIYSTVLPPGAIYARAADGNAMNSGGNLGGSSNFGQTCGDGRAFVYFRKSRRYVLLDNPPRLGAVGTDISGIADDNSVGVSAFPCSSRQTLLYRVTAVATRPQWSQPCTCHGYSSVGYNSEGLALNSGKLGPAVLTFPSGAPKISSLTTNVGIPAKAFINAVGTPSGFVGSQHNPKNGRDVPTVWLDGKPYILPALWSSKSRPAAFAMDERRTAHGLRVDIVGDGADADYWLGKPTAGGFTFVERRRFMPSNVIADAWGISTDGSAIFGDYYGFMDDLVVYFPALHKQKDSWGQCQNYAPAWGDSHGDILIAGPEDNAGMCLAQPKH